MNCSAFWEILAEYHEGGLAPEVRFSARLHLSECPECARLAEIVSGKLDLLESEARLDLRRSILRRTSGSACRRARKELKRHRRLDLDCGTAELLRLHLKECVSCRSAAEASAAGRRRRLHRLFLAPGFDWTAAYAGAVLVLTLLVGMEAGWDPRSSLAAGPATRADMIISAVGQESQGILYGFSSVVGNATTALEVRGRKMQETAESILSGTQLWVASRAQKVLAGQQSAWSKIHLVLRDILG